MINIFRDSWFQSLLLKSVKTSGAVLLAVTLTACVENATTTNGGAEPGTSAGDGGSSKAPALEFSATPGNVIIGGTVTLNWKASGATTCVAAGAWFGSKALQGTESVNNVTQSSDFTLTCSGAGGDVTKGVSVTVNNPAPTISFTATPAAIEFNATTTLAWSVANANQCEGSGAWSGTIATSGTLQTESLTSERTYTLTCNGSGGMAVASVLVTVAAPPVIPDAPVVSLEASPTSVAYNTSSTLTWSSTNATACSASGAWSGVKATSGTTTLSSLKTTGTYTLTCSGSGGSGNASVTINVQAPPSPTVTFTATPTTVANNGSTTFVWSSTDATACTASNAWSGSKTTSGTQTLGALTSTGTYTLTCSGAGGSASQSVTVTVQPSPAPTVTLTATLTDVVYNGSATLNWSSTNATACTASGAWSGNKNTTGSQTLSALKSTGTYTLTCTGTGGNASKSVTITVQPPAPSVTLTATPSTVAYNGSATLAWTSTNATTCSASGGWSGTKATSGSQTFSSLTASATYTLACTGSGGTTSQSVNVTVQAATAPTVTLSANPTSVAYNGSTTLTWSSTNATACTASGAWMGSKATAGSEALPSLTTSGMYTLTCTGSGGSANQSVTVTVVSGAAGTITGFVDSSRIDRNGINNVYLYAGSVTPDDYDGDSGDPVASAIVSQDNNACTFGYTFSNVAPGTYTVAFTNQAANDVAGQNDTISFVGAANITVTASAFVKDFSAARVLKVGSGKTYATPSAAYSAAQNGDVIEIDAGVYQDDVTVWRQNNLTLRGVGGRAHIKGTQVIPYVSGSDPQNGMGLWVLKGNNTVVENIEFSGAQVTDENGAGIRASGSGMVVCNGYFHDNEDGILGGAGEVLIEYSEFDHNGIIGDGYTHNLYMDYAVTKFVFRHNYSHRAHIGHELKSRAVENHILYNRLMNEDGDASYTIDVPNGGLTYIIGNLIQQGPNTDNSTMVNYGSEGLLSGRTHNLYMINNTLVNDRSSGTFVAAAGGTAVIAATNNLFVGSGTDISGPSGAITRTTNLATNSPGVANLAGYDYHLTSNSTAINQGSDPGIGAGYDLHARFQYAHPAKREMRPVSGAYDIGAYEYAP